jgi:hypothetical protein
MMRAESTGASGQARSLRRAAWLAAAILGLLVPGCADSAARLYQAAELGQPLPSTLPDGVARCGYGAAVRTAAQSFFPASARLSVTRVLVNDDGSIVARNTFTHGLCMPWPLATNDGRCVLEVEVPESCFREPAGDWLTRIKAQGLPPASGLELLPPEIDLGLLKDGQQVPDKVRPPRGDKLSEVLDGYRQGRYRLTMYGVHPSDTVRVTVDGVERVEPLSKRPASEARDLDELLAAMRQAGFTQPANAPEYLIFTGQILSLLPCPSTSDIDEDLGAVVTVGFMLTMLEQAGAMPRMPTLIEVMEKYPQAFAGLTRPGFHWRGGRNGVTVETQNLGGRRIRIQFAASGTSPFWKPAADEPAVGRCQ